MSLAFFEVVCQECATRLDGATGKDAYKHLLHCLKVEQDSFSRMRVEYGNQGGEHAKRVLHIVDYLLAKEVRQHAHGESSTGEGE